MALAENAEKELLKGAIERINEEIEYVNACIEDLKNSLSIPHNPAPMNPDQLEDLLGTKLEKFDYYIELCRQESLKKSQISYLLQENPVHLNPYSLPNSILSEKLEINSKMQKMRMQLRDIDSQILKIRSKSEKFSFFLSPKPFLVLSILLSTYLLPRFFL